MPFRIATSHSSGFPASHWMLACMQEPSEYQAVAHTGKRRGSLTAATARPSSAQVCSICTADTVHLLSVLGPAYAAERTGYGRPTGSRDGSESVPRGDQHVPGKGSSRIARVNGYWTGLAHQKSAATDLVCAVNFAGTHK